MFRSMMLVCALGALGAVGCVGTSDAADESAVAQNTDSGGALFNCSKVGVSVVQCVGSLLDVDLLNINVENISALNNVDVDVLNNDLNNLKIEDINILNANDILNDVELTVLQDFLTKFSIPVLNKDDIDVCALVGLLQICK